MKHTLTIPLLGLAFALHAQQTVPSKKLADTLRTVSERTAAKYTPEQRELHARALFRLQQDGLLFSALNKKDKAPDFTLKTTGGRTVHLAEELQKGPVVLVWYRGGWSATCTVTLRYLQAVLPRFRQYGARLFALCAENPGKMATTKEKNKLGYDLLYDADLSVAKQYGIAYTVNDTLRKQYETRHALAAWYGQGWKEWPLTAAYIIHPNGKIVYAFLDADDAHRAEPADLLRVLQGMGFAPAE